MDPPLLFAMQCDHTMNAHIIESHWIQYWLQLADKRAVMESRGSMATCIGLLEMTKDTLTVVCNMAPVCVCVCVCVCVRVCARP